MTVLCAWCGKFLRECVSHGICKECEAKHFPEEV